MPDTINAAQHTVIRPKTVDKILFKLYLNFSGTLKNEKTTTAIRGIRQNNSQGYSIVIRKFDIPLLLKPL